MAADESRNEIFKDLGLFAVIGAEILGFTGAGIGLGYEGWTHWGFPWWSVPVLALVGLGLAMWQIYRFTQVRASNRGAG